MKKFLQILLLGVISCYSVNCGYTTKSLLPNQYRTIYIEPFENKITYTTERSRSLYVPLLEVKLRNAVVNRFLFDGNLKVSKTETADLILKGSLIGYERQPLRYSDADSDVVEEYRINIVMSLILWDPVKEEVFWEEPQFVGDTTQFVTGSQAKSEEAAINDAVEDIARRIVDRTIENW